jgi:hypothetical protein
VGEFSAGAAAGGGPVPGGGVIRALSGGVWEGADVERAIQQLVWAHAHAPEGARAVAMEYVVANCRAIRVGCVLAACAVGAGCWRGRMLAARALWTVDLRCQRVERGPGRAAADLRCDCVQRDAGHTVDLLQSLPVDVNVTLFNAMSS